MGQQDLRAHRGWLVRLDLLAQLVLLDQQGLQETREVAVNRDHPEPLVELVPRGSLE